MTKISHSTVFELIRYETEGPIGIISLNRPGKLNAINGQMLDELDRALSAAEADNNLRVILLQGEGRAFSAGFDLDMGESDSLNDLNSLRRDLKKGFDVIMRCWESPLPTIAAVHKYCLGSAMEMALACDITIASEDCRFGAPEVKFGSGMVCLILPWIIGVKQAKELLLSGDDRVTAERALSMGLINRMVQQDDLMQAARQQAQTIAANDRLAVSLTKQAINRSYACMGMREALLQALDLDVMIESSETTESREFNKILKEQGVKAAIIWRDQHINKNE